MKKLLITFIATLSLFYGCVGVTNEDSKSDYMISAEKHIADLLDKLISEGTIDSYSDLNLEYSSKSDSLLIYTMNIKSSKNSNEVSVPIEFYCNIYPSDDLDDKQTICVNFINETKPILQVVDEMMQKLPIEDQTEENRAFCLDMSVMAASLSSKTITKVFKLTD